MSQHTIGQLLSYSRQQARASVYQASQDTKIRVDFLEAMEGDDFEFVSGGPYVRGMLRSYVRWLGLPEDRVLAEYDRLYGAPDDTPLAEMITRPSDVVPKARRPQWLIAAIAAACLLLVFSLVGLMSPSNEVEPPPDTDTVVAQQQQQTDDASPVPDLALAPVEPVEPEIDGVQVHIDVVGAKAWMEAYADDQETPVYTGTKFGGEELLLEGRDSVKVTIGDLGAVRVNVNGQDLGPPGAAGNVATFTFTPESTSFVGG